MKRILQIILAVGMVLAALFSSMANAASSANFSITTSVLGGGGGATSSDNFRTDATAGQPTPIMDEANPPWSDSYDNHPGFWYTLEAVSDCRDLGSFAATFGLLAGDAGYSPACDFDQDGDVDGTDLAEFISGL